MRYVPASVESKRGARPARQNPATVPPAISDSQRSLALTLVRAGGSLLMTRETPDCGPAAVLIAVVRRVAAMGHLGTTGTEAPNVVQSRCRNAFGTVRSQSERTALKT